MVKEGIGQTGFSITCIKSPRKSQASKEDSLKNGENSGNLLLVLFLAPRGFSTGTPVFLSP